MGTANGPAILQQDMKTSALRGFLLSVYRPTVGPESAPSKNGTGHHLLYNPLISLMAIIELLAIGADGGVRSRARVFCCWLS